MWERRPRRIRPRLARLGDVPRAATRREPTRRDPSRSSSHRDGAPVTEHAAVVDAGGHPCGDERLWECPADVGGRYVNRRESGLAVLADGHAVRREHRHDAGAVVGRDRRRRTVRGRRARRRRGTCRPRRPGRRRRRLRGRVAARSNGPGSAPCGGAACSRVCGDDLRTFWQCALHSLQGVDGYQGEMSGVGPGGGEPLGDLGAASVCGLAAQDQFTRYASNNAAISQDHKRAVSGIHLNSRRFQDHRGPQRWDWRFRRFRVRAPGGPLSRNPCQQGVFARTRCLDERPTSACCWRAVRIQWQRPRRARRRHLDR